MSFLISNAWAAGTTTGIGQQGDMSSLLLLLAFVVVFYFILWRPQAKRAKDQRNLLANLAKGDEVATSGGLLGKISKITDDFIILAITDAIEVTVQKSAIVSVFPKGTLKTV